MFRSLCRSAFYVIGVMQRNRVVCVSARAALVLALCFLAVTLLLSMGFFAGSVSRTRFFFGPNVMYRIYGVVAFLLYFVAFRGRGWARLLAKGTILAALVLGCLATGSRGGLVTIVVVVVCIAYIEYFDRYDLKAVRLGLFTTIGAMLALLVVLVVRLGGFRSAKFNPGNSSEAIRLGNYAEFQDYLEQTDWLHLLMGTASGNGPYSFYPHNAVVESVVWGGALPTAVMLAAIAWLIGAFLTGPTKARFFAGVGIVISSGRRSPAACWTIMLSSPSVWRALFFRCAGRRPYQRRRGQ